MLHAAPGRVNGGPRVGQELRRGIDGVWRLWQTSCSEAQRAPTAMLAEWSERVTGASRSPGGQNGIRCGEHSGGHRDTRPGSSGQATSQAISPGFTAISLPMRWYGSSGSSPGGPGLRKLWIQFIRKRRNWITAPVASAQAFLGAVVQWPHTLLDRDPKLMIPAISEKFLVLHRLPAPAGICCPGQCGLRKCESSQNPRRSTSPSHVDRAVQVEVHVPGPVGAVVIAGHPGVEKDVVALAGPDGHEGIPGHDERRDTDVLLAVVALSDRRVTVAISRGLELQPRVRDLSDWRARPSRPPTGSRAPRT